MDYLLQSYEEVSNMPNKNKFFLLCNSYCCHRFNFTCLDAE